MAADEEVSHVASGLLSWIGEFRAKLGAHVASIRKRLLADEADTAEPQRPAAASKRARRK